MENFLTEQAKKQTQLIDDLLSVSSLLDEVYQYHPSNPKQINVEEYFRELSERKVQIETELAKLEVE
jgi:hypothetical protein